ncbi:MAG: UbiA family prenyltransferase [Pseudomonadota bacterium]
MSQMSNKPAVSDVSDPVPEGISTEGVTPVLAVDLDGTLIRTDSLHEALLGLVARDPRMLIRLPGWFGGGRSTLKAQVADHHVVPGEGLPYNEAVLETVRAARNEGRRVALVSAADQRQVAAVADHLGLFDEAHGSTPERNLKGPAKAQLLTERFGAAGFDYIGDSAADVAVWKVARRALTVSADATLRARAAVANPDITHLAPPAPRGAAMLRAMRPHQWSKNALIFLPVLAAHELTTLGPVLLAFAAFCLTASAVYVINDLLDLPSDRAHPRKRARPFASGALPPRTGLAMAVGLLLGAALLALAVAQGRFFLALGLYLVVTFAYSLRLKRELIVDVITLAGLYTVRIVAGGAAAAVVLSPWMLGFSMFLFLSLAAVKRQAELTDQATTGRGSAGRAYEVDDLPVLRGMALSAGYASVMVLALYISSPDVQQLYRSPTILWGICPLLLYWVSRMVMVTHRGRMTDDPIVFAARDRTSLLVVAACVAVVFAAKLL